MEMKIKRWIVLQIEIECGLVRWDLRRTAESEFILV